MFLWFIHVATCSNDPFPLLYSILLSENITIFKSVIPMGGHLNCFWFGAIVKPYAFFLCLHDLIYLDHLTQGVELLEHRTGVCLILLVCAKCCSEWFIILFTLLPAMYGRDFSLQCLWYILSRSILVFLVFLVFGFNFHFLELLLDHDIKSRLRGEIPLEF